MESVTPSAMAEATTSSSNQQTLGNSNNQQALVFMTDFGLRDGAVAAMKGVALAVEARLALFDLTHEIPAFQVWEGAYRLYQTVGYWQAGTVFVVVVDPGVGMSRKSLAVKTDSGQMIVCPDNGLLTWLAPKLQAIYEIDEEQQRLPGSSDSYTFLGRDLYAYVGAKLASGQLKLEQIGPSLKEINKLNVQTPQLHDGCLSGMIPVLDIQFGNIWSNIPKHWLEQLGLSLGDHIDVRILEGEVMRYHGQLPYVRSFGAVANGEGLLYVNSLLDVALGLHCDNFARRHGIGSGVGWSIELRRV
jgi:S-adenosylmethionine hydrolase